MAKKDNTAKLPLFDEMFPKDQWGNGEWQNEPDTFEFEYRGIKCEGLRNMLGAWCGYLILDRNNPLHKTYAPENEEFMNIDLECHGGVTYAGYDKTKDIYRIGFDCSHYGDYLPTTAAQKGFMTDMIKMYNKRHETMPIIDKPIDEVW